MMTDGASETTPNSRPRNNRTLLIGESRAPTTRDEFHLELARLRSASKYSYRRLAELIDGRPSTVHGWINGRHLPYQRDNESFERLLQLLGVNDPSSWMTVLSALRTQAEDDTNPYPGLRPYGRGEADRFFGRHDDQVRLIHLIERHLRDRPNSPIIVTGASGIGKSSLVNVTVGSMSVAPDEWLLVNATEQDAGSFKALTDGDLAALVTGGSIVVDQAEQLLGRAERAPIWEHLEQFASAGGTVLVVLRSDYFDHALSDPWLTSGLQDWTYTVGPLSVDSLARAIVGPAAGVGRKVDADLVSALTIDFADEYRGTRHVGALPMLAFVLREIASGPTANLSLRQYRELGGLRGALDRAAEQAYSTLGSDGQRASRLLFLQLVEIVPDAAPRRRIAPYDSPIEAEREGYDQAVARFIDRRLIEATENGLIVAHEALFQSWRRLRDWIRESHDELMALSELHTHSKRWADGGQRPEDLLRGVRLAVAESVVDDPALADRVDDAMRQFVDASRRNAESVAEVERRRSRHFRNLAIATAFVAIIALVMGLGARAASKRAGNAERAAVSRELTLVGQGIAADDPVIAGQIALAADAVEETAQSRSALIDLGAIVPKARYPSQPTTVAIGASADGSIVAYSDPVGGTIEIMKPSDDGLLTRLATVSDVGELYAIAISDDGRWLATGGVELQLRVWDLADPSTPTELEVPVTDFEAAIQSIAAIGNNAFIVGGTKSEVVRIGVGEEGVQLLPGLPVSGTVWAVGASPDGALLATGSDDGTARVFKTDDLEQTAEIPNSTGLQVTSLSFSNDNSMLAVGYRSNRFELWDLSDPSQPVDLTPADQEFTTWVNWVAFSPTNESLVAASADGTAQVWRTSDWTLAGPTLRHTANVIDGAWIMEGTLAMTTANGEVSLWRLDTPQFTSLNRGAWSVSFTPDGTSGLFTSGQRIAIASADSAGVSVTATIPWHSDPDETTSFSASGEGVIANDGSNVYLGTREGTVIEFDPSTTDSVQVGREFSGLTALVEQVAISNDGQLLAAVADDNHLAVWNVDGNGTPLFTDELPGLGISVQFSADGSMIAVGSAKELLLYRATESGSYERVSSTAVSESDTFSVAFHPVQPVVAVGSDNAKVRLYDVADPNQPSLIGAPISGAYSRIYEVTFSADGRYLAAGASVALVWDITDMQHPKLWARLQPQHDVYSLRFNDVAQQLVGGGAAGELYVWNLDTDAVRKQLCGQAGTLITEDEWTQYLGAAGVEFAPPCAGENSTAGKEPARAQ